jgi:hypothetical protein
VVLKRLTLEHTGPKRTAHLWHTWLVSPSCRALSLAGHGSKHTSNAEGLGINVDNRVITQLRISY